MVQKGCLCYTLSIVKTENKNSIKSDDAKIWSGGTKMIIIGEKINGSIPAVAEAIAKRDAEFIKERARIQTEAGATCLNCCASVRR